MKMTSKKEEKKRLATASRLMTAVGGGDQGEVSILEIKDRVSEDVLLDRDFINFQVNSCSQDT